jgi:HK97 family phage major capsid protein
MFDLYSAADQSDERALQLLSAANVSTPIAEILRNMAAGGPPKRRVPTSALRQSRRDMDAATNGAYLVSTTTGALAPLLRGYSVVAEAGVRVLGGLIGNLVLPRVAANPGAVWIAAEGDTIGESMPTLGQLSLMPKYVGLRIDCSRQLLVQSSAEDVIEAQLGEAVGTAIDNAVFQGSGSSGEPLGICNTTGIFEQSGTSLGHAGLLAMMEAAVTNGARYNRLVWFAHPDTAEILGGRERASGSGFNLDGGLILGRPCISTTAVPSATLVLCDPSRILLALFDGQGCGVERDDFSSFNTGLVGFRLLLAVDVAINPAAAFAVASSIT